MVGILVLASLAIRMWALETAVSAGTFAAIDADSYLKNARALAQDGEGWRWTNSAVAYPWAGQIYYLPPLYPVFLSVFVLLFENFQYWAAVGQVAINALSVAGLFVIGASVHSHRAGVIAALIYTGWLSSIWRFGIFIQEQLYLPLLIVSFALLLRATSRQASPSAFALAGAVFGLATLTRSMPLYFMIPAAIGYVAISRDRAAVRRASALLAGFLLVTGLYSVFLSYQLNRFMFVENHAGISIELYGVQKSGIPGHDDIAVQLLGALWQDPARFFETWWGYVRALFHVPGDRWLHAFMASDAQGAVTAKFLAHVGIDAPWVICVLLAPFGAVLARRSREAALLVLWVVIVLVLTALSATGGVRYRSPIEPGLIVLASVVIAGAWRRPRPAGMLGAVAGTLVAGSLVVQQIPRVAEARANYGLVGWAGPEVGWRAAAHGAAGFNLLPNATGSLEMVIDRTEHGGPVQATIRVDGHPIAERTLTSGPERIRLAPRHQGFHFIEVTATDASGNPAPVEIEVWR